MLRIGRPAGFAEYFERFPGAVPSFISPYVGQQALCRFAPGLCADGSLLSTRSRFSLGCAKRFLCASHGSHRTIGIAMKILRALTFAPVAGSTAFLRAQTAAPDSSPTHAVQAGDAMKRSLEQMDAVKQRVERIEAQLTKQEELSEAAGSSALTSQAASGPTAAPVASSASALPGPPSSPALLASGTTGLGVRAAVAAIAAAASVPSTARPGFPVPIPSAAPVDQPAPAKPEAPAGGACF